MSRQYLYEQAHHAVKRYADAVAELAEARRVNRTIRDACERYEASESPSGFDDFPMELGVSPCPWNWNIQGENWCAACSSAKLPDLKRLKAAKRRALAVVLRVGRVPLD